MPLRSPIGILSQPWVEKSTLVESMQMLFVNMRVLNQTVLQQMLMLRSYSILSIISWANFIRVKLDISFSNRILNMMKTHCKPLLRWRHSMLQPVRLFGRLQQKQPLFSFHLIAEKLPIHVQACALQSMHGKDIMMQTRLRVGNKKNWMPQPQAVAILQKSRNWNDA